VRAIRSESNQNICAELFRAVHHFLAPRGLVRPPNISEKDVAITENFRLFRFNQTVFGCLRNNRKTSIGFQVMKAGRPSYHIPSKWITVSTQQGMMYFRLDDKGNLVRGNDKQLRPDHIAPIAPANTLPQPVQRPRKVPPPQPHTAAAARATAPPTVPLPAQPGSPAEVTFDQFFDEDSFTCPGMSEFPDDFGFEM
jgi:hypothetical protein